jgi:catechol 2,3-dioxygenase-like lactoylglutathione lyase family enzyme
MQLVDHVSITVRDLAAAKAAAVDRRRHVCFRAASQEAVKAFHAAGLGAGGADEGAPGLRSYHPGYYAAFLRDPEGNKIEAVFHGHGG